jgi:hypothetical protein
VPTQRSFLAVLVTAALLGCARDDAPDVAAPGLITLDTHVDIPLDFATPAVDPLTADCR